MFYFYWLSSCGHSKEDIRYLISSLGHREQPILCRKYSFKAHMLGWIYTRFDETYTRYEYLCSLNIHYIYFDVYICHIFYYLYCCLIVYLLHREHKKNNSLHPTPGLPPLWPIRDRNIQERFFLHNFSKNLRTSNDISFR